MAGATGEGVPGDQNMKPTFLISVEAGTISSILCTDPQNVGFVHVHDPANDERFLNTPVVTIIPDRIGEQELLKRLADLRDGKIDLQTLSSVAGRLGRSGDLVAIWKFLDVLYTTLRADKKETKPYANLVLRLGTLARSLKDDLAEQLDEHR
jgi:hypothetical protein